MTNNIQQKMHDRIEELEEDRKRALQAYRDKDSEVNEATRELSDRIRQLREERGRFALEASACQQKINELRGLLSQNGVE